MSDDHKFTRRSVLGATGLAMAGGFTSPVVADHDVSMGNQFPETCEGPGFNDTPQLPDSPWRVGDACRPHPPAVAAGELTFPEPPADATVLIGDGDDEPISLDDWDNSSSWEIKDNYVVVGDQPIVSKNGFGDGHYHVEWQTPPSVTGSGQTPGNSGFFLANQYEIQILNNYENPTYADGYAASVYGQHPPLVNASRPKGNWNAYDIIWQAPRFAHNGDVESPGVVTVYWNNILVQSQTVLNGPTAYKDVLEYSQHPVQAPIKIQDHGQPVRFRNVWYQSGPTPESVVAFDDDQLTAENVSTTLEASITNEYSSEMADGDITLAPPSDSDVAVSAQGETSFGTLAAGDSQPVSWKVTRPNADSGPYLLNATISFSVGGDQQEFDFRVPVYPEPKSNAPPEPINLTKTKVADATNAMKLDVAPDGRVFFTQRGQNFDRYPDNPTGTGKVRVYNPDSGETTTALEKDVHTGVEEGAQGIAFDPEFEQNGWIYFFYDPSNEVVADTQAGVDSLNTYQQSPSEAMDGPQPYDLVSRFTVEGDTINPDSEVEIIRIPAQRERCCHVGGALEFDHDGNLLITTGDGTDPFESSGFTPIDERDGRKFFDAQRSAGNTNDLRGSLLRITPKDDGGYTVPDGNLFTSDEYADARADGLVKTEIYAMGFRNPFTLTVDEKTGHPYIADYGPDSGSWDPERGPLGITEWVRVDEPGFYGWPYFTGMNVPYRDYDFATGESGEPFDPENPINDSPNNDGLTELPPAQPATITNPYNWNELINNVPAYAEEYVPDEIPYPLEGTDPPTGGSPMIGELYNIQDSFDSDIALPGTYDGAHIIMERRGWFKTVSYDSNGEVSRIGPFPLSGNAPMMLHTGKNGGLYLLEYGGLYHVTATEESDIEPVSAPFGYDAGGSLTDGNVTIDGLEFVGDSPAVQVFNQGGNSPNVPTPVDPIDGTEYDLLYQSEQWGENLSYDIHIEDGVYDVTLHLAELAFQEPDTRVMNVSVQGTQVIENLDLYEEVGFRTAYTKTVENVEVTDGILSITTSDPIENSKMGGIEIRPAEIEPISTPFGFDAGGELKDGTVSIDDLDFVEDSPAVHAYGDADASGNDKAVEPAERGDPIDGTNHDLLYQTELYGGDLSFDVAVENGTYDVTLYFAEIVQTNPGDRVFDVSVEGQSVYSPLDIYAEVGHDVALTKTVEGVEVTDGTLTISTVTQVDNSKFSGFKIQSGEDNGGSGEAFELGGKMSGWVGQAPSSIDGKTNPTLSLVEGKSYTITFENLDGAPHDLHILDDNGDSLVSTEFVTEKGGTATIEFTASPEMAEYYCSAHPTRMRGTVTVEESDSGGDDRPPAIVGDSRPTDPDGDGLYEDVDGDGEVTYNDVVALFDSFEGSAVQNNPEAFDFNQNGQLDFDDIIELFNSM
ncbi:malectin domain-containing carbohydrate-binding protein [Haladaptatus sp. CMAA 1911]|uniref:malectin domain-containing carbohydrate-binding protein n=1 Tax=unclassified Haladaptatus TaxID=2622732 RepID=UPI0037551089